MYLYSFTIWNSKNNCLDTHSRHVHTLERLVSDSQIASKLEAIAISSFEAIATRVEAIANRLEAIAFSAATISLAQPLWLRPLRPVRGILQPL